MWLPFMTCSIKIILNLLTATKKAIFILNFDNFMKSTLMCLVLVSLVFYSCKHPKEKKELMVGAWRTTNVENRDVDNFFANGQIYIDTIGNGHDAETNQALYGVTNMDSLKKELQVQLDSVKKMQLAANTQTVFTFKKDGKMSFEIPGHSDPGNWHINKAGELILTEKSPDGQDEATIAQILTLDDTAMKLMFVKADSGMADTSYVSFHKERK